jgi:hypothetical protein
MLISVAGLIAPNSLIRVNAKVYTTVEHSRISSHITKKKDVQCSINWVHQQYIVETPNYAKSGFDCAPIILSLSPVYIPTTTVHKLYLKGNTTSKTTARINLYSFTGPVAKYAAEPHRSFHHRHLLSHSASIGGSS